MIAITDGLMLRAWRSTSRPSRSGIRASDTTRANGCLFSSSMAARPFSATTTSCPSRLSRIASSSRIDRSSSTTRMRADWLAVAARSAVTVPAMSGVPPLDVGDCPLVRGIGFSHGQRYLHARAFSLLRGNPDLAAIIARDALDDGEPEARAIGESAAEPLEDAIHILGGGPDAFVVHAADHFAVAALSHRPRPLSQPQLAARPAGAQAVGGE